MKLFRLLFTFFLLCSCIWTLHAQHSFEDSAFTKSSSLSDSARRQFIVPIPLVGSIDRSLQSPDIITDSMRDFYDYRFTADLLSLSPGMFMREFGSPGLIPDITIDGLGAHEIAFLYDGIELNDPLFGIFNPYLIPTESLERIEYITGSEASLYGLNSTDAAIDILTKSKKAIHAYSRLRYSESGNGYSLIDGMVSQDIIRGLNITAGAQHTTYGPGFPNTGYDAWNGRFKIRYNINKTVNLFFSELFNQTQLGLNGGVNDTTPVSLRFDQLQSTVNNPTANEKTTRHDLQLGAAMHLFPDSTAVTTVTLYLSSSLRQFIDPGDPLTFDAIPFEQDQWSQWMGIKADHFFSVGNQTLNFGAEIQSQRELVTPAVDEHRRTLADVYGKASLQATPFLVLTPYGRLERYIGQNELSYGVDGSIPIEHSFSIFAGYSRSFRFPTFEERYGLDTILSSSLSDESIERHHVVEAGFQGNQGRNFFFKFTGFYHTIFNMITIAPQTAPGSTVPYQFIQNDKEIVQGFSGTVGLRWSSFYAEGTGEYLDRINHDDETPILPKWNATGGIYYWDTLFNNHLNLKVGIRGKFFTDYTGEEFNQQSLEYLPGGQSYPVTTTGTLDFVLIAHLGTAYIHFIAENLADQQYVMTSFYPMPGREFRFGVSWEFTD